MGKGSLHPPPMLWDGARSQLEKGRLGGLAQVIVQKWGVYNDQCCWSSEINSDQPKVFPSASHCFQHQHC
jgi:hypothetical protein